MIPNTVNTIAGGHDDDDSTYSDDDIDFSAIERAAAHFEGMGSSSRGQSQSHSHSHGRSRIGSRNIYQRQSQSQSHANLGGNGNGSEHRARASILSKQSSVSSNDASEKTIFRRNGGIGGTSRYSSSSIHSLSRTDDMSKDTGMDVHENTNVNTSIYSSMHGGNSSNVNMAQIDEQDHEHSNCRIGSFSLSEDAGNSLSTANSTRTDSRTDPSVGWNNSRHSSSTNLRHQMTGDEDVGLESSTFNSASASAASIASFSASAFPQEVHRFSSRRRSSHTAYGGGGARRRTSFETRSSFSSYQPNNVNATSASASFKPRLSSSNPRKRRSYVDADSTEIQSAAAQVAQMFANGLLDSDTEGEDDFDTLSFNSSSRATSRRNSARSMHGHGLAPCDFDERPKKRLSSSSGRSFHNSCMGVAAPPGVASNEDLFGNNKVADSKPFAAVHRKSLTGRRDSFSTRRESFTPLLPIAGSGTSSTSEACTSVAAAGAAFDEPSGNLMRRLSLQNQNPPVNNIPQGKPSFPPPPPRQRAQRRAGFVVSSLEREALETQAERMKRLEMDREESRRARGGARRSMSYSSGIKMKSSIIGIHLPEDQETLLGGVEAAAQANATPMAFEGDQDIQRLTRSRMERRVNSMPDPNAISRLSRASINEGIDFSDDMDTHSSALSATLEASSEIARTVAASGYPHHPPSRQNLLNQYSTLTLPNMNTQNFQNDLPIPAPQGFGNAQGFQDDMYLGRRRNSGAFSPGTGLPQNQSFESLPPNPAMNPMASLQNIELQSAAALQANAMTQQATVLLQTAGFLINAQAQAQATPVSNMNMNSPYQQYNAGVHTHTPRPSMFNADEFDGKKSHIISIPATAEAFNDAAILLQEACKKDDAQVIQKVLETCPLATRIVVDGCDSGDVAIHVAARNASNNAARMLLDVDSDSALIRNTGGHVALHLAVQNGNLSIVTTIVSRVPESSQIQCEEGFLPLHDAVSFGSRHPDTPQIITLLQHRFGNAVFVSNDEGLLPIHLASSSGFTAGLRTLLSSEFSTIFYRDKLEDMLPLDVAVHELEEATGEDLQGGGQQDDYNNDRRENFVLCIETILSSMLYNRLISDPRDNENADHPFLPLHSAIRSRPLQQTWNILYSLYSDAYGSDVDPLGRNIAHAICSREIDDIKTDILIVDDISAELFLDIDNYGFIPLHLSLQNPKAHFDFVKAVVDRHKSSLSREVQPLLGNKYAHFVPFQIATDANCSLDIIYFLIRSHPSGVRPSV